MKRKNLKVIIWYYNMVRDMPFEVRLNSRGYREDLDYIKIHHRGSCSPKHYLLGAVYEKLGLEIAYLTFPFYWKELDVNYPNSLRELAEKMPLTYHLALAVHLGKRSFLLDATWDSLLEKAGFPINKIGRRLRDTRLAVVPCGFPIRHSSALERSQYIQSIRSTKKRKGVLEFYSALNTWLEEVREVHITE